MDWQQFPLHLLQPEDGPAAGAEGHGRGDDAREGKFVWIGGGNWVQEGVQLAGTGQTVDKVLMVGHSAAKVGERSNALQGAARDTVQKYHFCITFPFGYSIFGFGVFP